MHRYLMMHNNFLSYFLPVPFRFFHTHSFPICMASSISAFQFQSTERTVVEKKKINKTKPNKCMRIIYLPLLYLANMRTGYIFRLCSRCFCRFHLFRLNLIYSRCTCKLHPHRTQSIKRGMSEEKWGNEINWIKRTHSHTHTREHSSKKSISPNVT